MPALEGLSKGVMKQTCSTEAVLQDENSLGCSAFLRFFSKVNTRQPCNAAAVPQGSNSSGCFTLLKCLNIADKTQTCNTEGTQGDISLGFTLLKLLSKVDMTTHDAEARADLTWLLHSSGRPQQSWSQSAPLWMWWFVPAPKWQGCTPSRLGLLPDPGNSLSGSGSLCPFLQSRVCSPLVAAAAAHQMPGRSPSWVDGWCTPQCVLSALCSSLSSSQWLQHAHPVLQHSHQAPPHESESCAGPVWKPPASRARSTYNRSDRQYVES